MKILQNKDISQVLEFLNKHKHTSLFSIGNIETYGLEHIYEGYGFYEDTDLVGCVFIYARKHATAIFDEECTIETRNEMRNLLAQQEHSDFTACVSYFEPLNIGSLYSKLSDNTRLAKTQAVYHPLIKEIPNVTFHVLEVEDTQAIEGISRGLATIQEFGYFDVSQNKKTYQYATLPREWVIYAKEEDVYVASARVTGISETTAVIISVWVMKEYRGKGIARQMIQRIIQQFSNEIRDVYIFYSNPIAARIYLANGFEEFEHAVIAEK